jgi:hypothetical protein
VASTITPDVPWKNTIELREGFRELVRWTVYCLRSGVPTTCCATGAAGYVCNQHWGAFRWNGKVESVNFRTRSSFSP